MPSSGTRALAFIALLLGFAPAARAQSVVPGSPDATARAADVAVIAREADGRVTVRARRVSQPIRIDGRLDDEAYATNVPFGDFIQQEPREGEPATEQTDVWLFFDDKNIYVSARCWDSHPERDVANDMRRDGPSIPDNENFAVTLDTFDDRRNAFIFYVGLAGGLTDAYLTDERDFNRDWNTVWDAKIGHFDGGWTVEMVIPFKSLRFKQGQNQPWGVNFRRTIRWKNEATFLTRIPAAMGRRGLNKISSEATLVGIEMPSGRNFELKPYGIADTTKKSPTASNEGNGDFGMDAKVGVTQGLTADFSYNTDFAQVEVDEQQVNLTRFNILFPEKREFFLEGQGIFSFGGLAGNVRAGVGPGGLAAANPAPADIPILFFGRRIGLTASQTGNGVQQVPIDVGGRLTGKSGPYAIGLLDIHTGESSQFAIEPTNFGAVRIKRDVGRRSAVGALFTDRSISSSGGSGSRTFGVDGAFAFYENLSVNTYLAKVWNPDAEGDDLSYRGQVDYNGDRYGVQAEHLFVGENFIPDVGFLKRGSFRRDSAFLRFSPRPTSIKAVRKFTWDGSFDYITNPDGGLESRLAQAAFRVELQQGDMMSVEGMQQYEYLARPFTVSKGVTIPVGGYSFPQLRLQYLLGPQRKVSGIVKLEQGQFYDGDRTEFQFKAARIEVTPELSVEPGITIDWVDLPQGQFTTKLLTTRATYTVTPRMAVSALTQYVSGTHALGTNVRFRWEYTPGSDLFIVYTDDRDTLPSGFPALQDRSFVVKLTRLFRL